MEVVKLSLKILTKAITILKNGGVVICPTDTVYGFLADASNKKAVGRIFKVKKRPKSKVLPVFVKDVAMAKELALINEKQEKFLKKFWPGKYTFILKRKSKLKLYGISKKTIAIRIPKYKFLQSLLKKINKPLVQTSVNISGEPPLKNIEDIMSKFGRSSFPIFFINGGSLKKAKSSKIIDLTSKLLTRIR